MVGNDDGQLRRRRLRRIADLRPIDDEFMRVLFKGQLELAQEVLRIITGIEDLVLLREETQRDLKRLEGARSVCLDVYGTDSEGTLYDLEVQRAESGARPRRARYHSSAMDIDFLDAGSEFETLPESYVIFVIEKDYFGKGKGVYPFERTCQVTGELLDDGSHVLYANASYEGSDALGDLMHDFLCADPAQMRNKSLAARAAYFKNDEQGVSEMSKVFEEEREEGRREGLKEGRKEGRREGRREGREEGVLDNIVSLTETLKLTASQAMDALRVPDEDRARYLAMIEAR